MMIEQAEVIRYQNGIATVQCQAKSGCGSCSGQTGCGTKSLSALAGEKTAPQFELPVNQPLAVGDMIELGLAERSLLQGVLWLYGLPLLVLIASSLLLSHWIENELMVALLILLCTATTFFMIKKRLARTAQGDFEPIFVRKVE